MKSTGQGGFLLDCWYVAAWCEEVTTRPLARRILDEPVVLWRTASGRPQALLDRCPHRLLPLSKGEVVGEHLQCGYHGMLFDGASGTCVRVPGQDRIPAHSTVRAFPVTEHMGMVWIWMGDPARASSNTPLAKVPWGQPGWGLNTGPRTPVRANYLLLAENLLDPVHVSYVHRSTLGTAAMVDIPVEVSEHPDALLVTRWTRDAAAPPILQRYGQWPGNVDRWQYYWWYPPSFSVTDFGAHPCGSGESEAARQAGVRMYSCHFLTPETAGSTHYFWLQLRNFAVDDAAVSRDITEQFILAFSEDKAVLEAIEEAEQDPRIGARASLALDAGGVRMRRRLARMIEAERAGSPTLSDASR